MTDPMILIPLVSLTLPGLVAFVLGRVLKSVWPGVILGLVALGSGVFFMSRASGAQLDDGAAINSLFAAFGISLPALVSALVGGALAFARR